MRALGERPVNPTDGPVIRAGNISIWFRRDGKHFIYSPTREVWVEWKTGTAIKECLNG